MADLTDAQRKRLPKYAQDELRRLENELASERKRIEMMGSVKGARGIVNPYAKQPFYLGPEPRVRFLVGFDNDDRDYLDVRVENVWPFNKLGITIVGSDSIAVAPKSSNVCDVVLSRET